MKLAGNNSPDEEVVTIVLHSGAYDRAAYALSLALVALASGMEVHMLLTFEGLRRFTKGHLEDMGDETSPVIRANIERGLKSGGIQSLEAQLADAKRLGLKIYACSNAMGNLNIIQADLLGQVDSVIGLAAFLAFARAASINWYI